MSISRQEFDVLVLLERDGVLDEKELPLPIKNLDEVKKEAKAEEAKTEEGGDK